MPSDTYTEWETGRSAIRRGWWFIALAALGVMGVAAVASYQLPVDQRSTGRLIVAPSSTADVAFSPDSVRVLTQPGVIGTLTQIVENPGTFEAAADEAGISATELADYSVAAQEVAGSMVVEVHVDGPDAAITEQLAASLIDDSTQRFDELYPVYRVHVLDGIRGLEDPVAPSVLQYSLIGGIVGASGAVLLLIVWDRLRRRFSQHDAPLHSTDPDRAPAQEPRFDVDGDEAGPARTRTIERT